MAEVNSEGRCLVCGRPGLAENAGICITCAINDIRARLQELEDFRRAAGRTLVQLTWLDLPGHRADDSWTVPVWLTYSAVGCVIAGLWFGSSAVAIGVTTFIIAWALHKSLPATIRRYFPVLWSAEDLGALQDEDGAKERPHPR